MQCQNKMTFVEGILAKEGGIGKPVVYWDTHFSSFGHLIEKFIRLSALDP